MSLQDLSGAHCLQEEPAARPESAAATLETRPRLARGFRFQWEPAQDCHVLLYPEGMVKLNPSAGAILECCDGERRIAEIVAELQTRFAAEDIAGDVLAFVAMAGERRWLAWDTA
ncbi:pyrroloquinoline quinone biosynthesis peptide chaperone PqqD [Rubrivivax gelatinosus]|uniref:pyrroloquinoline quinone biosynthesis peptide chaperone PqqD n=1 Tax=Rubrivivax gelatinosus TaxID=28068 RepID=UPI001908D56A|nr:pyrroloquinoline quinone biosynthesis peptide chaperone PqqD [Rubrivivax gelatinosus]MBK1612346.1 pyrroloquinoline quinone biosynthesis peptide chaperone PqqD [Rubrivivax gelatinosus]